MNDLHFLQQSYQEHSTRGNHQPLSLSAREQTGECDQFLVALSTPMVLVAQQLEEFAALPDPVLIVGPPGSGKKFAAFALHSHSPQRFAPLQIIHCGQMSSQRLLEEIAWRRQQAPQGTLVLDQMNLVSIKEREQIINLLDSAAANASRWIVISSGPLALSLHSAPLVLTMPPLSKRLADLPQLVNQLLLRLHKQVHLSASAWECFEQYRWPGNVGELANLLERLALLHPNKLINPSDLPSAMKKKELPSNKQEERILIPDEGIDLNKMLEAMENNFILAALEKTQGNKNGAAKLLRINRTTLIEKMKKKQLCFSECRK